MYKKKVLAIIASMMVMVLPLTGCLEYATLEPDAIVDAPVVLSEEEYEAYLEYANYYDPNSDNNDPLSGYGNYSDDITYFEYDNTIWTTNASEFTSYADQFDNSYHYYISFDVFSMLGDYDIIFPYLTKNSNYIYTSEDEEAVNEFNSMISDDFWEHYGTECGYNASDLYYNWHIPMYFTTVNNNYVNVIVQDCPVSPDYKTLETMSSDYIKSFVFDQLRGVVLTEEDILYIVSADTEEFKNEIKTQFEDYLLNDSNYSSYTWTLKGDFAYEVDVTSVMIYGLYETVDENGNPKQIIMYDNFYSHDHHVYALCEHLKYANGFNEGWNFNELYEYGSVAVEY